MLPGASVMASFRPPKLRRGLAGNLAEGMREGGNAGIAEVGSELLDQTLASVDSRSIAEAMRARWHQLLKLSCVSDANSRDSVRAEVPTARASVSISCAAV